MRILFMGSGEFGVATLKWLRQSHHEMVEVITQPARPAGRGKKLQPTPIFQTARQMNLNCLETVDVNAPALLEHIKNLQPEIILVIAFGQKIGKELLNLPGCRAINLHGSLLPKYRGAAPINWAIINGERETGLTVIEINEVWDAGAILGQLRSPIKPQERAGELHDRLAELGPELVAQVLEKLETGTLSPEVQNENEASRAPKLGKEDGAICWSQPAQKIRNHIHGTWPWPGAYCYFQKRGGKMKRERLIVARTEVMSEDRSGTSPEWPQTPGMIAQDMSIGCGSGRVQLLEVKAEGGKLMPFDKFVNGRHLQKGDVLSDG